MLELNDKSTNDLESSYKKANLQNRQLAENLQEIALRDKTSQEKNKILEKRVADLEKKLNKEIRNKLEAERQLREAKKPKYGQNSLTD